MTSVLLLVLPLPFDHATVASLQPLMTLHTIPWPMSTTSTRPKLSQTAARSPDARISSESATRWWPQCNHRQTTSNIITNIIIAVIVIIINNHPQGHTPP